MIQGFYRLLEATPQHLNHLLRILFDRSQAVQTKILTSAPGVDDLEEGEMALMDDESSIRRIYFKINSTIRYVDLT